MATLLRKVQTYPAQDHFLTTVQRIASHAADKKAKDIVAFDVRGLTVVADSFVICTATSEPQAKAVLNTVREGLKEVGIAPIHTEGTLQGGWILMDYGDVIFHIFREESREFYDLDGMWADADPIPLDLD